MRRTSKIKDDIAVDLQASVSAAFGRTLGKLKTAFLIVGFSCICSTKTKEENKK